MLNFILESGPLVYFGICAFVFGALLGSLMNVFVARLPYEKSVFWPGSGRDESAAKGNSARFSSSVPSVRS